ncbi:hypothetical protein F4604DRAFT_1253614 [Suillus subluteus]|nr:hypothetical protein F4604DRAFT_1253614 [Suillus subluteus]
MKSHDGVDSSNFAVTSAQHLDGLVHSLATAPLPSAEHGTIPLLTHPYPSSLTSLKFGSRTVTFLHSGLMCMLLQEDCICNGLSDPLKFVLRSWLVWLWQSGASAMFDIVMDSVDMAHFGSTNTHQFFCWSPAGSERATRLSLARCFAQPQPLLHRCLRLFQEAISQAFTLMCFVPIYLCQHGTYFLSCLCSHQFHSLGHLHLPPKNLHDIRQKSDFVCFT